MSEFFLAVGGVAVASLTAVYSAIIDGGKSAAQKWVLVLITVIGLGLRVLGAWDQKDDSDKADKARDKAQTALTDLQKRVGDLDAIDTEIKTRSQDLTKLNLLGGSGYYIVGSSAEFVGNFANHRC
jgi:hypothetical protein